MDTRASDILLGSGIAFCSKVFYAFRQSSTSYVSQWTQCTSCLHLDGVAAMTVTAKDPVPIGMNPCTCISFDEISSGNRVQQTLFQ